MSKEPRLIPKLGKKDDDDDINNNNDVKRRNFSHGGLPAVVLHRCGLNFAKLFHCSTAQKPSMHIGIQNFAIFQWAASTCLCVTSVGCQADCKWIPT